MPIIPKVDRDNYGDNVKHKNLVYGRNIVVNKNTIIVKNEDGFITQFTVDLYIVGVIEIPDGYIIYSSGTSANKADIHLVTNNTIVKIVRFDCATTGVRFPNTNCIRGEAKYNNKRELIVSWWDGVDIFSNKPCLLNLSNLPFPSGIDIVTKELNDPLEAHLIRMFPDTLQPNYEVNAVQYGGAIRSGMYAFIIGYEINANDFTDWVMPSRFIPVGGNYVSAAIGGMGGMFITALNHNEPTSQAISLTITGLDQNYGRFKLAVIIEQDGVISVEEVGVFNITSADYTLLYAGETTGSIATDEIMNRLKYTGIYTGTNNNRRLTIGNVKINTRLDFQPYANNIKIGWTTKSWKTVDVGIGYLGAGILNENGKVTYYHRNFMPDEVYAFYIHLIYKDGTITEGYNIPGRNKITRVGIYDEDQSYTPVPASWLADGVTNAKFFHLMDTSVIDGHDADSYPYGRMGYWENKDEEYPANWTVKDAAGVQIDDYSTEKVRHHKFPASSTYEWDYIQETGGAATLPHLMLGITIEEVNIPTILTDQIQGWFISFAKREYSNITNYGDSVALETSWMDPDPTIRTVSTYPYGLAPPDNWCNWYRFYDYNLLSLKPIINPSYVKGTLYHNLVGEITSFSDITINTNGVIGAPILDYLNMVLGYDYIPAGDVNNDNEFREEFLKLIQKKPIDPLFLTAPTVAWATDNIIPSPLDVTTRVWMISLHQFILNAYVNFTDQDLVPCAYYFPTNATDVDYIGDIYDDGVWINKIADKHFGGDIYFSPEVLGLLVPPTPPLFPWWFGNGGAAPNRINVGWHHTPINFQYRIEPNIWGVVTFTNDQNNYDYNRNYIKLNNVKTHVPYDPDSVFRDTFPHLIARSIPEQLDIENWRTFLSNYSHERPKHKGEVIHLDDYNKILVINQRWSLFFAYARDTISGTSVGVGITEPDIFAAQPEEIGNDKIGYIGCDSTFAAGVTIFGYICCDSKTHKIFLISANGQPEEISMDGLYDHFNTNFTKWYANVIDIDNPLISGAITELDELNARFIFNFKDFILRAGLTFIGYPTIYPGTVASSYNIGDVLYFPISSDTSNIPLMRIYESSPGVKTFIQLIETDIVRRNITNSYSNATKGWVSWHDYNPTFIFKNKNGLFSIDSKTSFKHNYYPYKGKYYNPNAIYPAYMDIMFNDPNGLAKLHQTILFRTTVIRNGVIQFDETINKLMIYTENQCSGYEDVAFGSDWFSIENGRRKHGLWYFNSFRDAVINNKLAFLDSALQPISSNVNKSLKDWFDLYLFICTFAVVRLYYANAINSTTGLQSDIFFNDCDIKIQKSTL